MSIARGHGLNRNFSLVKTSAELSYTRNFSKERNLSAARDMHERTKSLEESHLRTYIFTALVGKFGLTTKFVIKYLHF